MNISNFFPSIIYRPVIFFGLIGLLASCDDQKTTSTNATQAPPPPVKTDTTSRVQDFSLTLPVLNALFIEEGFKQQLKTELEITDEQIKQLETAAGEAVAELSEGGTNYLGSARAARKQSEDEIRRILGEEKAESLARLVAYRYAGGDIEGLFPTTPNAVPNDTRVVINAPAFRMDVFQQGKLVKTYKIGIGYPEFPLPTGMRKAESIIFNPTWTPPDEPWVKGKFQPGRKVAAGSKLNPLGVIKIPIGLPSLIHGGKDKEKLGNFASHGCVGLTNEQVQDFTTMLGQLGGSSVTAEQISNFEKQPKKTETIKLSTPVPIELRYETIVAENGSIHIFQDVYERGTNTVADLVRILQVYGVDYQKLSPAEKQSLTTALTEMNLDSNGNPIAEQSSSTDTTLASTGSTTPAKDGVAASKQQGAKTGKVTRNVTGIKELSVPIAALKGKGYPAAVMLNAGE
ncbi:L,D-transpeptidase family protein [Daejeonella lutea]|uniref:L,D-transpeptidase catalytic domain n=1 Tax=Daejeonella lutea TaxID=572036 RepID=A0A1T5BNM1_9SPHI|nr:L,D-transpeptidase family protein [Daejeonella lutea]SKB48846.1 L,D-transpeptidase catalytic domain [Daejeonella lutea]